MPCTLSDAVYARSLSQYHSLAETCARKSTASSLVLVPFDILFNVCFHSFYSRFVSFATLSFSLVSISFSFLKIYKHDKKIALFIYLIQKIY